MKSYLKLLLFSMTYLGSAAASAQNPEILTLPSGTVVERLSDNGLWGLSQNGGETDEGLSYSAGGKIWNISAMTSANVSLPESGRAYISDISDDGNIIVGSCSDKPAYYEVKTQRWVTLPLPDSTIGGGLTAVTPDGAKAVGYANLTSEWDAMPLYYDLTTGQRIELPNIPVKDMNHVKTELGRFCDISPDGRYILGRMSEQMLMPISMCAYVYDTFTNEVHYIGFTPNDTKPWIPDYKNCAFIDNVVMSADGNYVTGRAYIVNEIDGSDFYDEYYTAFRYNVKTGITETFDGSYDSDVSGFSISNDGTVFASVPADSPYADMVVRFGNYYYPFADICSQAYNLDFEKLTGETNTGKPVAISGDGQTLAMITGPTDSYILKMHEDWSEAVSRVNLLNSFLASPAAGSVFSTLSNVKLTFSRNIDLSGAANRIKVLDAEGKTLQSALAAEVTGSALSLRFRPLSLESGKSYTIVIPAGFVTMQGDAMVAAGEIKLTYIGRSSEPVEIIQTQPANGSTFSRLDALTNYITLKFNASLAIADGASAQLRRKGDMTPVADLALSLVATDMLALYPAARQYLYDGTDYEVILPAGSVTDISGAGPNEEIILNYIGNYIREVSADDKYLFVDECDNYNGFMFFDGDRLTPAATPSEWGFTADVPWYLVRENESATDMAMAAHSMFVSSGRADDWAVTPQLFIPDNKCYLAFEAQSYLKSKADRLKVYAYVCNDGYSSINADIVADMKTEAQLIFDQQLSPGESEESLSGDWTTYTVKLADFAGKNIYLAFVNDNENQSAVFVNRVEVVHDMSFMVSLTSPSTVVGQQTAEVNGVITPASDITSISSIALTLKDASGSTISTFADHNVNLTKGQSYDFAFPAALPLADASITRFTIEVTINGSETSQINGSIKNLTFAPRHRVVVEEYSGRDCSNCPRGFKAMENLEKIYPDGIIPIVIRTYESDPLGAGLTPYSDFLGLNLLGAPSAAINRTVGCYPTYAIGNKYYFSGEGLADDGGEDPVCWLDAVAELMKTLPDADITFNAVCDASTNEIAIDGSVKFALNTSRNVSLFTVLLENDVPTTQLNGMRYFDDPILGEWGKGGIYGEREVTLNIDHVARATFGSSFNGTSGLIPFVQNADTENPFSFSISLPESVVNAAAAEVVVMMIDSDTDAVINAEVRPLTVINSAITEIESDQTAPIEYFNLQGRRVAHPAKGQLLIKRSGAKAEKIIY